MMGKRIVFAQDSRAERRVEGVGRAGRGGASRGRSAEFGD